jgi:coenzyme Q-binding protein COQ10
MKHTHAEKTVLPFTAKQMYTLVADIEKYPEFLPWCIGARINERKENVIIADLVIGYKMIREKFTSKVTFEPGKRVNVDYITGPFRHLHNYWIFRDTGNGQCEIDFYIDFAFKSSLLQQTMSFFFNEAFKIMVSSFEKRAQQLYGKSRDT